MIRRGSIDEQGGTTLNSTDIRLDIRADYPVGLRRIPTNRQE